MKIAYIASVLMLGIVVYFFTHLPKFPQPAPPPADRDAIQWRRGRAIYNSRCIMCHNANPDLPGNVGPKLRGVSQELLDDRLTNGKGAMPAMPHLKRFVPGLREYLR